jgi:hypothetical protein
MERTGREYSFNDLYDFFCMAASEAGVQIFSGEDRAALIEDIRAVDRALSRSRKRGSFYSPIRSVEKAPGR